VVVVVVPLAPATMSEAQTATAMSLLAEAKQPSFGQHSTQFWTPESR
jgi:hypothetical protein